MSQMFIWFCVLPCYGRKKYPHQQAQLKAILNYTNGKLNTYIYLKLCSIMLSYQDVLKEKYISKLFLPAINIGIRRWKLRILQTGQITANKEPR